MIAADSLYEHWGTVFGFVRGRMRGYDPVVSEDITADAFERALRRIGTFEDRGKGPLPWLITIASRRVVDWRRSAHNRESLDLTWVDLRRAAADAGSDRHVDQLDLGAALDALGSRDRQIVIGHVVEGQSQGSFGAKRTTTRRRYHAALASLRADLGTEVGSPSL